MHTPAQTTRKFRRNTNSDRTHDLPQVSGYKQSVCCSNSLSIIISPYLHRPPSSNVQGFKLPVIHVVYMFRLVSVAHHNRESVGYIVDTTPRFLFVRVTYLQGFHFQIRAVVINSQVNPRHDGVRTPVVLSLNTSLMSQSSTSSSLLAYQSNPLREIFAEYLLTHLLKYPCNCTSRETVILTFVRIFESSVIPFIRVFLRDFIWSC